MARHKVRRGLSQRGFGDLVGRSQSQIRNLINEGILTTLDDGSLDRVEAYDQYREYQKSLGNELPETIDECKAELLESDGAKDLVPYDISKARLEETKAKLADIQLAKEEDRVVDKNEVYKEFATRIEQIRDSLLVMPNLVAPEMLLWIRESKKINETELREYLRVEIVEAALSELSSEARKEADAV